MVSNRVTLISAARAGRRHKFLRACISVGSPYRVSETRVEEWPRSGVMYCNARAAPSRRADAVGYSFGVPEIARIAAMYNMSSPANPPQWKAIETAARSLGLQPQLLDVRKPEDFAPAFAA